MTFKTMLKATTAAALVSIAGQAYAHGHIKDGHTLADDQTYTYRLLDDIVSFDPQISTDVAGAYVLRDLFEGLTNADSEGNIVPGLAESWDVSEDGMTYTFHLRESKWSNGTPVKASDVVYAWQRLADPAFASEYAWYMELMGVENAAAIIAGEADLDTLGVTAEDDKTLVVKIDAPRPYFTGMLTHASTFPVPEAVVEELGKEWTKPGNLVGNGAYVLTDYQPGVQAVRERNPMYWDNEHTTIEKVTAIVITDENVALTRYDAGELDMTDVPSGQFPKFKEERPDEVHNFPRSCSYIYAFNLDPETGNPVFQDVNVRRAVSYALNRDIIVENVLKAGQYPSYNWTHQKTAGFEMPEIEYAGWTQAERNAKAAELLAEAGYSRDNPVKFTLQYNTSEGHKKIAIAAQQMWKQQGIEAELANYEWKVHLQRLREGDFEVARYAWCGDYNEASTYLDLFLSTSGHNNGKFFNDEYDALAAASKTSDNPNEQYTAMEQILADQMPVVPVYQYTGSLMMKPNVKGYPFNDLMANVYSRAMYKTAE